MMTGIIVTVYNRHDVAENCLKSIVCQELPDAVTIIIDDGSDRPFQPEYLPDNSILHRFDENCGPQYARNYGWNWLSNRYDLDSVLFCDGDVIWEPGGIKVMQRVLSETDDSIAFVYCNYYRTGIAGDTPWTAGEFSMEKLRAANFIVTTSLIKAPVLRLLETDPFIEDEERLQDWSLWLRICNMGFMGRYIPRFLFRMYYHRGGISSRGPADYRKWYGIIRGRYVD